MKKLKLSPQLLQHAEVLTRSQLKTILGGDDGTIGTIGDDDRPRCTITTCAGHPYAGDYYYCTNTTSSECQGAADSWCSSNNDCCDIDCPEY